MIKAFINKIKPIYTSSNHVVMFYLLGIISIFLNCEILKASPLIKQPTHNYNNCIKILKNKISMKNVVKVCEILNYQENFQDFAYNIFYTVLLSYALIREVIHKSYFNIKYWILAHLSAVIFALIGELDILKFSIDSKTKLTFIHCIVIFIPLLIISILILRQLYYSKLKLMLICKVSFLYLIIYILLRTITNNIFIHLHHSFICGLLSLCFTDFTSSYEKYAHAIFMGIVVQGLNFFSLSEILIFNISDKAAPAIYSLSIIYSIYLGICLLLIIIKRKACKKNTVIEPEYIDREDLEPNDLEISLLPNDDITLYRRL
jgi:hypothetical protein